VIHDTGLGSDTASEDSYCTPAMNCIPSARVEFQNNLMYNLNLNGAPNWCFQLDAPNELTIDHNTCISGNISAQALFVDSYPTTNTLLTNNIFNVDIAGQGVVGPAAIVSNSSYGTNSGGLISNDGGYVEGWSAATLTEWSGLATNTFFSTVNPFSNTTTYPVVPGSLFSQAGTDGADLGWNSSTININNIVAGLPN
jgi:hypothetical protein